MSHARAKRAAHNRDHDDDRTHDDGDADFSHKASAYQRATPTDGVDDDDGRFGSGGEAFDLRGRVAQVNDRGEVTRVKLEIGKEAGVRVNMEGYVMRGDSYIATLEVISVSDSRCVVEIDAPMRMVDLHLNHLVINPSTKPTSAIKPAKDLRARVLRITVHGTVQKLVIGAGLEQGVMEGFVGNVFDADGKSMGNFEIREVCPRSADGFANIGGPAALDRIDHVIVNPPKAR
jgi:hypothetical protein